ncbi:MAG TPA: outer membrane protein transport protein [Myxococcales bacterium]|jgi:long-chain fatty acid transport protein
MSRPFRLVLVAGLVVFAGISVGAGGARAASFHVGTQDARATAMGMAMTADVDDASAALYNPAGLAQPSRLELRLGASMIIPTFKETVSGVETSTQSKVVVPPTAYLAYSFNDEAAIGVGVFSLFGLEARWPDDWIGRYTSTRSSLRTVYINPEIAYRFLGRIRFGAGVQVVRGSVDIRKQVPVPIAPGVPPIEITSDLEGVDWGVGGNLGLQIDILEKGSRFGALSFGATYRSGVTFDFQDARANFSNVPAPLAANPLLQDQKVTSKITLPQVLTLGVAWNHGGLRLAVDTEYTGWQTVGAIDVVFANPAQNTHVVKNYHHTWNLHVGGEYAITPSWLVRLGFMYDPTPSPSETLSPDLPDADRLNFAGGVGFRAGGFAADVGYQYVLLLSKDTTFPVRPGVPGGAPGESVNGGVHVIGLTLGYNLKL